MYTRGNPMESKPMPLPSGLLVGITALLVLFVGMTIWRNTLHRPDIRGTWSSVTCEESTGGNDRKLGVKRSYEFTGGEWKAHVDYFADPRCSTPTFSFELKGSYELGDKSTEVEGATHGEFNIASIELTPHLPEVAQVFEQSKCGNTQWEVDVPKSVGDTGCLSFTTKI